MLYAQITKLRSSLYGLTRPRFDAASAWVPEDELHVEKIDQELKARAIRLVNDHQDECPSLSAAAAVVAKQLEGCQGIRAAPTYRSWNLAGRCVATDIHDVVAARETRGTASRRRAPWQAVVESPIVV